ncbi:MAG: DUF5654 family protein [Candidatus Paceibacterota bacterium]|jgi:hypothetical protein
MDNIKNKIVEEQAQFKKEARNQALTLITTSFSLVAGLAWNEAIKSLIEFLFPLGQNSLVAKLLYAVLITLFIVVVTYSLSKMKVKDAK